MKFPPKLIKGQTIGIYSPSGSITYSAQETNLYQRGINAIVGRGYSIKEARFAKHRFYHMSAPAKDKADDIHSLFLDPDVSALLPSVGGHTASQILSYLDLDIIRANPKVFVGFSDSAVLAMYIADRTGLVTFHSAVDVMFGFSRFGSDDCPMQDRGAYTTKCLWDLLEQGKVFQKPFSNWLGLRQGEASGTLLGGNLKGIQALLGTPYEPNWTGKILYWEAADPPYVMAQVLTHLKNAQVFEKISGMVVGKVAHLKETFYAQDEIMPIHEFIKYIVGEKYIPIIVEADFGHDIENIIIPNGCQATLWVEEEGNYSFKIKYE